MKHQNYSITKDGFGIHTFQLTLPSIDNESSHKIMEHIERNCISYYRKDNGDIVIYPPRKGMRIYINRTRNGIGGIRVVVAPAKVLDEDADPIKILNAVADFELLYHYINTALEQSLGEEYDIDSFYLSRIDCCVNIMLSESYSAERYIKLISRSMKYSKYDEVLKFPSSELDSYEKNEHSFRIETGVYTFTAYDKYYQLEDIGEDYNPMSEAMLRLEISVARERICEIERYYNIGNNISCIEFYAYISQPIFREYIQKYFSVGDYYCYETMCKKIGKSGFSDKRKLDMLAFAERQISCKSFKNARNRFIKYYASKNKYYKVIEGFESLDMNPMSLACRDKHGNDYIPGLYELLDI